MFADEAWKFLVGFLVMKDFVMEEGKFEWRGTYRRAKRGILKEVALRQKKVSVQFGDWLT